MQTHKTAFTIPVTELPRYQQLAELLEIALDVGEAATAEPKFQLTWFATSPAQQALLAAQLAPRTLAWEEVPTENWQAKALADFPPITLGDYVIIRNNEPVAAQQTAIAIPPAMAFGSGEHATTAACLKLYQTLIAEGQHFTHGLDMGAGSGILAIAAAKRYGTPMLCVDNDAPSVVACAENAELNGVATLITSVEGDGFNTSIVSAQAPYPLIFANILAAPLIDMAAQLAQVLSPAGYAHISGYLDTQAEAVLAAYTAAGLTVAHTHVASQQNGLQTHHWCAAALYKPAE